MTSPSDYLLATKLEMPQLASRVVRRSRLTDLLQSGLDTKVSLVVAPAGYGKTTLLGEWIINGLPPGWRIAWVSLDAYDNEIARFWSYVVGAIRKVYPGLKSRIRQLAQPEAGVSGFTFLDPLINELAACPYWICLVLDDYHLITREGVHQSLGYFLEHQPKNFHLVLSSRSMPPIPLSRYRARGQLAEVITSDLSFTPQEADVFLSQVMDLEFGHEQVEVLANATEGWIAGLKLAALSYGGGKDLAGARVDLSGINRQTFDFLLEEVLNRQDNEIKEFLLKTSVLSEFSASLCNAILGRSDSQQILEEIIRKNLFIIALDNGQNWYRYHQLFAETLRLLLQRTYPQSARSLQQAACRWMEENGHPDKAVSYALDAGDLERAAQIIDDCALEAVTRFNVNRLVQWISRLTPDLLAERPQLSIYEALAYHLLGKINEVRPRLVQVEQSLQQRAAEGELSQAHRYITWQINALRAVLKCLYGETDEGIQQILALRRVAPEEDDYFAGNMTHILAESYAVTGRLTQALEEYEGCMAFAQKHSLCFEYAYSLTGHAYVLKMLGRLSAAERDYRRMLEYIHQCELSQTFNAYALTGAAEIALERNDLARSGKLIREVEQHLAQVEQAPPTWIRLEFIYYRLAKHYLACQDYTTATVYFDHVLEGLFEKPNVTPFLASDLIDMRVRLWEKSGDDEKQMRNWLERLAGLIPYKRPFAVAEETALARIALAGGRTGEAAESLARIRAFTRETGGCEREIETLVLLARCAMAQGRQPEALEYFSQALEMAEPEGYLRPFIAEGQTTRPLIEETLHRLRGNPETHNRKAIEFCARLLENLNPPPTSPATRPAGAPRAVSLSPLLEPLSSREEEVARLLSEGKTTKEIAGELIVSINTAKSHLQNIYRKLGVHTREDALRVMENTIREEG